MKDIIKILLTIVVIFVIFVIALVKFIYDDMKLQNASFINKYGVSPINIKSYKAPIDELGNNEETQNYDSVDTEQDRIEKGYTYINKSIFTNGEKIESAVSAKGQTYEIIGDKGEKTIDGVTYTTRKRLIYDRESKNEKCYEYVYYEDYLSSDGTAVFVSSSKILNTYAVVKTSGQVIPSGKTSWEAVGSKEFNNATGDLQ